MTIAEPTVKEQLRKIVDHLPDDATWEDAAYAIYVRGEIAAGLDDLENGRVFTQDEIERLYPES